MNAPTTSPGLDFQRGAVLIVSLLILVVLTLLGITTMSTSNLELVMATNSQAQTSALATAENSVTDGENWIAVTYPGVPLFDWSTDATDGLYLGADHPGAAVTVFDWIGDASANPDSESGPSGGRYTIEYLGPYTVTGASLTLGAGTPSEARYLYRITGQGTSGRGGLRFVETIFAARE